ncbi:MAG: RluA family pseudouridine synthase [Deltaproteobacteria bacterium]|nr:RluA family pseudouridine synthase [Deltaproteobacteria bacterium]
MPPGQPADDLLVRIHAGPPLRLDIFLHRQFPAVSRRRWQATMASGSILVNDRPGCKGTLVAAGDRVCLPARLPAALAPGPPAADPAVTVTVIHEDEELVVVAKPAGQHTHPLDKNETGTLANGLLARWPALAGIGFSPLQPGLLNRLDRDTSGLVLAARTLAAWEKYRRLLAAGQVVKIYLGVVHGRLPAPLTVDRPLIHAPGRPSMMTTDIPKNFTGRRLPALTLIEPLETAADTTSVRLTMRTGVTHQLRVHCAASGHPLVGDRLYGRPETAAADRRAGRLLLHAWRLRLPDGREFTCPPPWSPGNEAP